MPGIQALHLEDALDDSPQTRSLLGVFEKDANMLYKYTTGLYRCFDRVLNAQRELCAATQGLSLQLKAYETQEFPLESEDSILTATLKQFSSYLDELSSVCHLVAEQLTDCVLHPMKKIVKTDLDYVRIDAVHGFLSSIHRILAEQLADGMLHPISKFLQADLETIRSMQEMMKMSVSEHEASINRYMKLPKKKDNEKLRLETNDDLYVKRKGFHQTALHYYSSLNQLQYKRKCFLIEPMLGYMHAQKSFFSMGQDAVGKKDIEEFLSNMNASVQGVHQELGQQTQKTVELIDGIEQMNIHQYYADPPEDLAVVPPKANLTQKAGYLFMRSKQALLASKWDRCYFFIQGGNLMCQHKDEVAGSLVMDLNELGTVTDIADVDDRRFVFQVTSPPSKKTVVLQAESSRERDEWIATINNAVQNGGYVNEKPKAKERSPSTSSTGKGSAAVAIPQTKDNKKELSGSVKSVPPPTPPSTPSDSGFIPDAPIQFDMISPSDESKPFRPGNNQGPPRRINPFDQSAVDMHSSEGTDGSDFYQTFEVRFLGSMQVKHDRGESLVSETIRQIMAARALHNVFKTTDSNLVVSSQCMRLVDPSNNSTRAAFMLEDIAFWAVHKENKRLFGFITRVRGDEGSGPTFNCHVFECNTSGEEICHAISTATKLAFQALMERKAMDKRNKEKDLLLANIDQLEEDSSDSFDPEQPRLSADGRYVVLDQPDSLSSDLNPPITQHRGDGDERKVEGAECESEA